MKKIIFGVFAHPDDEAFGPAGTFLSEADAGNEVHLITLTAGQAGSNPDNYTDLGSIRLEEWRAAGEKMNIKSMTYLGYDDGHLCNGDMVEIAREIEHRVKTILAQSKTKKYEFLTFDLNGISGHIDHIVASRATTLAYYRLRETTQPPTRLRLFCLPKTMLSEINTDWIFMEAGREADEIDEIVDACKYSDQIREIVKIHHTQRYDGKAHLAKPDELLCKNHYIVH